MYSCANKWTSIFRVLITRLSVSAMLCQVAAGQSTFGTITGTVFDPSGAVVAGAKVETMNQGTSAVRDGLTDAEGNYLFLNLDSGTYTITVSIPPFGTQRNQDVSLLARETVRKDFRLQLSGTTAEVQVVAGQEIVTEVPAQASSLSGMQINSLALNFL